MNSLDVFEVIPIESSYRKKKIYSYKRLILGDLTVKKLKSIYLNIHAKHIPDIIESIDYFIIQYPNKPALLLNKTDGRIYSFKQKFDMKQIQHQASILFRIFRTFELIEEPKTKTINYRRSLNISMKEKEVK